MIPLGNHVLMLHVNMVRATYGIGQTHGIGGACHELSAVLVDHPDIGSAWRYPSSGASSHINPAIVAESEMLPSEAGFRGLRKNVISSCD